MFNIQTMYTFPTFTLDPLATYKVFKYILFNPLIEN